VIVRPWSQSDQHYLRQFRCATRHDPAYQRRVGVIFREALLPAMNEKGRELEVFVAEADSGDLAGIITLEESKVHGGWIVPALGVSVDHRRMGIATALIKFGVEHTPAKRADGLLFVVDQLNQPMQELVKTFEPPPSRPHPGDVTLELFTCDPAVVLRDLSILSKFRPAAELGDDELRRRGLGLGIELRRPR
jgi:GNAT superfamily N-acetyltransferase